MSLTRTPRKTGLGDGNVPPHVLLTTASSLSSHAGSPLRVLPGLLAPLAVELDPAAAIVSLDGRSAYDLVSRAAFVAKLGDVAPALLPFVRAFYRIQRGDGSALSAPPPGSAVNHTLLRDLNVHINSFKMTGASRLSPIWGVQLRG